ncbi:recombination protein NinG [Pseudomonas aeruginosa]|uniref:recombination protein NinG n=1 Tax=Pseudomonas aeruginosa TaxID=287 RepID=UPI001FAC1945|nr:recombination protein NinG [Pseudomonas aeruginosa]MCJ0708356.1 recombination protein NinG [Pseudomonas aeruginosa]MCU9353972.1 recombination protein NinG [Pseudomonas aeruginosa]MCU9442913.1 recombination protein NinG [Pseudomonas aeruginosa]HBN8251521.1 recombination protein NinG [Pseudomonas aeruginosa]HBP6665694.1 recombination protein NinG [Pseudomonas aeruginosa]
MTLSARNPRPKKCAVSTCRAPFVPVKSFQTWCSPECGIVIARQKQEKERKSIQQRERREVKVRKEKLKSRADHLREAQAAFNEFIRWRDWDRPCISCGRFHDGQYHAGHYRSVGSHPELRFDEDNVHKQCAPCNNHKSGDVVNYRINLVTKIGAAAVARLEGPHDARKWTVEEIKSIKALYRAKARDAKRAAA